MNEFSVFGLQRLRGGNVVFRFGKIVLAKITLVSYLCNKSIVFLYFCGFFYAINQPFGSSVRLLFCPYVVKQPVGRYFRGCRRSFSRLCEASKIVG